MTEPSPSAEEPQQRADVRVSDADRQRTVDLLQKHAGDGTLSLDEFGERTGAALAATTRGDLDAVVRDLPAAEQPTGRRTRRRFFVGIMSGATAHGRWRTGRRVTAVALMGGATLDFRQAVIDGPDVVVTAFAVMGGVHVIVPEGIEVQLSGFPIMGGKSMHVADVPVRAGSPRIVVRAFPIMGGVHVRSKSGKQDGSARRDHHRHGHRHERALPASVAAGAPAPLPADGIVTIMFSDVCGYSELTDRLGDAATHALLKEHNRIVSAQITAHGGQVVKSNGDGFMAAFASVARALRCAVAVQRALEEADGVGPDGERLRVHIGLHAGEAVRDGDDLLGQAVNVASRLTDAAGPEEILVSTVARELAAGSREFAFAESREVQLKGLGMRQAHLLDWRAATTQPGS